MKNIYTMIFFLILYFIFLYYFTKNNNQEYNKLKNYYGQQFAFH